MQCYPLISPNHKLESRLEQKTGQLFMQQAFFLNVTDKRK